MKRILFGGSCGGLAEREDWSPCTQVDEKNYYFKKKLKVALTI
jgi:hypothetical protein